MSGMDKIPCECGCKECEGDAILRIVIRLRGHNTKHNTISVPRDLCFTCYENIYNGTVTASKADGYRNVDILMSPVPGGPDPLKDKRIMNTMGITEEKIALRQRHFNN